MFGYILLSIFASAFSFFSTAIGQYGAALSRKRLHARMLNNILKCAVSFFDATPFAQIIDRFSTDTEITDKVSPRITIIRLRICPSSRSRFSIEKCLI